MQHDHHIRRFRNHNDATEIALRAIYEALGLGDAAQGWQEWAAYAAAGEW